jgi:hypothetical protein
MTLFIDPLPVDRYWVWFAFFLMLMVGLGYKAITTPEVRLIPRKTAWFLVKSTGLMIVLGLIAWLTTFRV